MFIFKVSVIIPVYNAEKFLENAVLSALSQDCVEEVILIEDKSPDNALQVCQKLNLEHKRVSLYFHPNNENRGAGASRNLGIKKAKSDFIAFLDADDWYNSNRFEAEKRLFKNNLVDGVYGAGGYYYDDKKIIDDTKLTSFEHKIDPDDLLYEIMRPNGGRFDTNSITIRKELLDRTGLFDESLRLHQDTYLWLKLAYFGKLKAGIIEKPISYRRVHSQNRIAKSNRKSGVQLHSKVLKTFLNLPISDRRIYRIIFKNVVVNTTEKNDNITRLLISLKIIAKNPKILYKML